MSDTAKMPVLRLPVAGIEVIEWDLDNAPPQLVAFMVHCALMAVRDKNATQTGETT